MSSPERPTGLVEGNRYDTSVAAEVITGKYGPDLFLEDFRGKLMADCYSGYQAIELRSEGRIERGACAAHARRKVFLARESYPLEASVVLAKFQQLHDIEDRAKTMPAEERLALRQADAAPVWRSLGEWLPTSISAGGGSVHPRACLPGHRGRGRASRGEHIAQRAGATDATGARPHAQGQQKI